MAFKAVSFVCAVAVLAQSAVGQYLGGINNGCGCGLAGNGLGYAGLANNGLGYAGLAGNGLGYAGCGVASTGGGLPVSSISPIAPVGVTVISENAYEGNLNVGGNLPFLGTVGFDGVLPTAGAGAISYGCGDGAVGIAVEEGVATGILAPNTYGPYTGAYGSGIAGIGAYGPGIAGYGAGIAGNSLYGAGIAGNGLYGLNGCGCGGIY